jgi:hypothetical protein
MSDPVEATRPRFSLVSAVHDVAPYLPEFIASIEAQTFGLDGVEIVLVDDGSTDESPGLLAEWAARRPGTVTVLAQPNAGQGAARNRGMAAASGEWISFPDPDDVLEPDYLAVVDAFLTQHAATDLVATHRLLWWEGTADGRNEPANTHPLRSLFGRDRLVDLAAEPQYFHGSAPAAFFRLDHLRSEGITFDSRIRPNFEDGHFTSCYLLTFAAPKVAFLPSARYHYRKRAAGTSTLATSRAHPGRYTDVIEHGYLGVVERARARHGEVPGWLASYLAYEIAGYFNRTDSGTPAGAPTGGPVADRMHELMGRLLRTADLAEAVLASPLTLKRSARYVVAHGYAEEDWQEPYVVVDKWDRLRKLVRVGWYYTGAEPATEYRADGVAVQPLHTKVRDFVYAGRPLLHHRTAWLPANRVLQVRRDGKVADMFFERPPLPRHTINAGQIRWNLSRGSGRVAALVQEADPRPTTKLGERARRLAATPKKQQRYRHAWVLMDRIHDAGDSAEILFRWLRANEPDVNAWFVLEKGTADWKRLSRAGYRDRLVAHGSLEWRVLMTHALHLISSHADEAVLHPPAILEFSPARWKFHFLQHGVIKDDISAWLNVKDLETFVTSTPQERASIAGDHTPYSFSTREVKMTGLPRFDRLLEVGSRFPPERRDLVLVAPTWRNGLLPELAPGTQHRELDAAAITDTEFMEQWLAYLHSAEVSGAARDHGARIGFLPHPNLQPLLPYLDLPAHVEALTYDGDVQELFARARVLVTDFSSVAFNAAYLDRPVVYFQFDEEVVLGGGHVGRAGYFDYRRDGFGPVATTCADAVRGTIDALEHGPDPAQPYRERITGTFPARDGRCCERVFAAVRATTRSQADAAPEPTPVLARDDGAQEVR